MGWGGIPSFLKMFLELPKTCIYKIVDKYSSGLYKKGNRDHWQDWVCGINQTWLPSLLHQRLGSPRFLVSAFSSLFSLLVVHFRLLSLCSSFSFCSHFFSEDSPFPTAFFGLFPLAGAGLLTASPTSPSPPPQWSWPPGYHGSGQAEPGAWGRCHREPLRSWVAWLWPLLCPDYGTFLKKD